MMRYAFAEYRSVFNYLQLKLIVNPLSCNMHLVLAKNKVSL